MIQHNGLTPPLKSLQHGMYLVCSILAVDDAECKKSYDEIKSHYTPQTNLHSITLKKQHSVILTLYNKPHSTLPNWQRASIELMDQLHIDHMLLTEQLKLQFVEKQLEATGVGDVSILYVYNWLLNRKINVVLKTKELDTSETDLWGIYQFLIQKEQVY